MSGAVSVGEWVHEVFVSNFGIDYVGRVGAQKFWCQQKMTEFDILVWEKHDFINFHFDSLKFYE